MTLSDVGIKALIKGKKIGRHTDERGLCLEISQSKGKSNPKVIRAWWRFRYRFAGKEKMLSLGVYPDVSLKDARDKCYEARKQIANDINPSDLRKATKASQHDANSFENVAREWFEKHKHTWADSYSVKLMGRLEKDIFPWIGNKPVGDIEPPELLETLRRIEKRGALESAHRVLQCCGRIFRYAIATGRAIRNPEQDLKGALSPPVSKNYPTITNTVTIGELLRSIEGYQGTFTVKCALKLAPLLLLRPGELRKGEWAEINWDKSEWLIPKEKMKGKIGKKKEHIVPLSLQVVNILKELYPLTGHGASAKYIFPSIRTLSRPMSENTVNGGLRRLGYTGKDIVGHGFRHMASTLLNENKWNADVIEMQLAHKDKNQMRGTYNKAQYLEERHKMMQWWADYLYELKEKI